MATSHLKQHAINETLDHAPGTNGTLLGTESSAVVEKSFGPTASPSLIVQRTATSQITVPVTPVATDDATSKIYVDTKVAEGITWKQIVLTIGQLENGGSGGINQAILGSIVTNPANNDTFVVKNAGTTETFTFKTVLTPLAFEVLIGGSVATTMQNLVTEINTSSVAWDATYDTALDVYFTPNRLSQFVVREKTPSAALNRVYGTIAGGNSFIQIISFNAASDYAQFSGTQADLPGADPAAKRFGFSTLFATLVQGETHRISDDNNAWTWDGDDLVWQQSSSSSSTTPGDGIDITAKVATAVAAGQFGGLVNTRTSTGTGTAAADAGFNAVKTDNTTLEINSSNAIAIKAGSNLAKFWGFGDWASTSAADKEPTVAELNTFFGSGATNVGYFGFMVETNGGFVTSTFMAYKKASGVYHLVEMS